ncbi:MAG TPA: glycosyltransferase family 39 protein [Candidatus Baltobacteraceae bacterium]|jgi:4-amino-4-deoxy-L-arabinose transferase-like glycosyltransferase
MTARVLTALAFVAHVATNWRYGYFRDELYFIACGRHLAWSYVDQPPLVAFAAWLATPFAYALPALRFLPACAAALTVWLACAIVRELGGGRFAQVLAGLATLLLPAYLLLGNTLTTTSFEPLSWTLTVYLLLRLARGADARLWLGAGAATAFGLYGKYSMILLLLALAAGLLCVRERRIFATWWFPAGGLLGLALVAPTAAWQFAHGWPQLTVLHGDLLHRHAFQSGLQLESQNVASNAIAFAGEQLLYTNPVAVPIWIAGLIAPFVWKPLRTARFVSIAYLVLLAIAISTEAKGYYIIGIYAPLLASGAIALEALLRDRRAVRWAIATGFVALTLPFVPISLPVLPIDTFVGYSRLLGLTGRGGAAVHLMQPVYAEEFGWDELTRHVAGVYHALPSAVRSRTGIFADTYADAGAIALFGPRYGLPPVVSGQNTFWLWGTGGYDGSSMIAVGATQQATLRRLFRHVKLVETYGNPYKWVVEGPTPIYLCTDPIAPLPQLWPQFKWYGA